MEEYHMEQHQIVWSEVLAMLVRRRKLIGSIFLIGIIAAIIYSWLQGPSYRATAVLIVGSARAHIPVSPDANSMPMVEQVTEQDLNSEVALLKSDSLVREVLQPYADRLAREAPPSFLTEVFELPSRVYDRMHGVAPVSPFEKWVRRTARQIAVTPVAKSDLIEVSYRAGRPEWAAEFVNQLVLRHVQRAAELDQQSEAQKFFENQRQLLGQRLGDAEGARRVFSEREGIDSVPEQRTQLHARLAELQSALAKADADLSEGRAREQFLQKELQAPRVALEPRADAGDPQQLIRNRLIDLELQRSQLLAQFAPTSIRVQAVDRQIADARRLLSAEANRPGAVSGVSPYVQTLKVELAQAQAQAAAVKARFDTLQQQIGDYKARLAHLDQIAAEHDRLEQDLTAAKTSFATYVKKAEEARFSHALDESRILNVTVAEPATVPPGPEPSRRPVIVVVAALLSLALGAGLAYLRDRIDPSVKSAFEAHQITGLPVLADIAS